MAVLYDLSGLEPPGVLTAVNLETEGRFGSRSGWLDRLRPLL